MIEETHSLKCHYKGVQPFVKVTAYELSSVDCSSDKSSGYYGETATLTANEAPIGYNFSGWNITGSQMTGNSFRFQGDVTAKAGYSAIPVVYNLALQTDGHGKIGANKTTGYSGDTVTLSNTASAGYSFKNYTVTGATINGSTLTFGNSNCTAKANYTENTTGNFLFSGTYNSVLTTGGKTYYRRNAYITGGFYYSGTVPSSRVLNYNAINWYDVSTAYKMGTYYFKNGIKIANLSGYGFANVTQTANQSLYFYFAEDSNGNGLSVQSRGLMYTGSHTGTASSASITIHTDPSTAMSDIFPKATAVGNVNPAIYTGYFIISGKLTG